MILFPLSDTLRQWIAARKLQRIVDERRNSFEIEQFRRRREAAKRGWRKRAEA